MKAKRHAPGLYTIGNVALSRECVCGVPCETRWAEREVVRWVDGYPTELGDLGFTAPTKTELIGLISNA